MFKLVIDSREKKVIDNIVKLNLDYVEISSIPLGDFIIKHGDDTILIIERKTMSDLVSSINDGRYKEQKIRLLSNYPKGKIVYFFEGALNSGFKNNEKISNIINGALINTTFRDNIRVIHSDSVDKTCELLLHLFNKVKNNMKWFLSEFVETPSEYSSTIKVVKKENMTPEVCQILQLSQIPGMSHNKAKAILEKYSSLSNLIREYIKLEDNTKEKEELLKDITINDRKLGKVLSKRVYSYL